MTGDRAENRIPLSHRRKAERTLHTMKQGEALRYAVRFEVIVKYFAQLCVIIAVLTLVPIIVSFLSGDTHIGLRYLAVAVLLVAIAASFGRLSASRQIQINEAMVVAGLLFLFTPLVMSYPMMASGLSFIDALFEAISGATTTGLSTLPTVEDKPVAFLFGRAWMQWYGGLGIVVLSLALFIRPGRVAKGLAVTETQSDDLVGGTRSYARNVLAIYGCLTVAAFLLIWGVTGTPFHAFLYALAAVSTGGYAPHDDSLAGLGGWPVHMVITLACLSGAVSLMLYHRVYKGRWRGSIDLLQFRSLLILAFLITIGVGLCMFASGVTWSKLIRDCSFLHGDGSNPAVLREVDPPATDILFCLTDSDQVNLIASLVGRTLGFKRIITSIENPEFEDICRELGLEHTIIPNRTIARYLVDMVNGIDSFELSTVIKGDARLFSFVMEGRDAVKLSELELPNAARIICMYRGEEFLFVDDETKFRKGDEVVLLTTRENLQELQERWQKDLNDQ